MGKSQYSFNASESTVFFNHSGLSPLASLSFSRNACTRWYMSCPWRLMKSPIALSRLAQSIVPASSLKSAKAILE